MDQHGPTEGFHPLNAKKKKNHAHKMLKVLDKGQRIAKVNI